MGSIRLAPAGPFIAGSFAELTLVYTAGTFGIDDTGMLKQGTHSVGVQRQYTGSAGKVTNCQIAVSLSIATKTEHVPVDFELYLPRLWTKDPTRRAEARIPDEIEFRTKPEIALDLIRRAVAEQSARRRSSRARDGS